MHFLITEVHNFGGFFGGDTVTVSGMVWGDPQREERTLTIDEAALANLADRHTVTAGMVLELVFAGERVEQATLLGARGHAELRRALGAPALPATLAEPLLLAEHCQACGFWSEATPQRICPICTAKREN